MGSYQDAVNNMPNDKRVEIEDLLNMWAFNNPNIVDSIKRERFLPSDCMTQILESLLTENNLDNLFEVYQYACRKYARKGGEVNKDEIPATFFGHAVDKKKLIDDIMDTVTGVKLFKNNRKVLEDELDNFLSMLGTQNVLEEPNLLLDQNLLLKKNDQRNTCCK